MNIKPALDGLSSWAIPVGTALADAPWWVVVLVVILALTNRLLPRESKDLLTLWLQIIPRQGGSRDRQEDEGGRE